MKSITCPNCKTYVMPTHAGECPACRTLPNSAQAYSNQSKQLGFEEAIAAAENIEIPGETRINEDLICPSRYVDSQKAPKQRLIYWLVLCSIWIFPGIAFGFLGILGSPDCSMLFYFWWFFVHGIGCSQRMLESRRLGEWWMAVWVAPVLLFFALVACNPFQRPVP